jgi:hypothetical protein
MLFMGQDTGRLLKNAGRLSRRDKVVVASPWRGAALERAYKYFTPESFRGKRYAALLGFAFV